jgi:peptidoglycan/LPS O-acetylase OafA/YrhL
MLATVWGPKVIRRPFSNRPVRWLAEISYGVYLIHAPAVLFVVLNLGLDPSDGWGSFLILFASVVVSSTIYGYLSARLLEQPIRRWARRFSRSP